jgi:uncharacterized protein YcbK (DUF882 family)
MFADAETAYLYAYEHGVASFPSDYKITENFTWKEAFVNEKDTDGRPTLDVFQNVMSTAIVLQKVRTKIGKPITVTSWVRQIPHNRRAGSTAKKSAHINGRAVDFHIYGMADKDVRTKILAMNLSCRLEDNTTGWVHLDIGNSFTNDYKWGLF